MKKWSVIAALLVLVIGTASIASARRGGHGGMGKGFFGEFNFAKIEARLKLTPQQSDQIRGIVRSERERHVSQFEAGGNNRHELMKAIFAENPNQGEINNRIEAMVKQHEQMLRQMAATGTEVNKVFTPEQRAEVQRMLDENAQAASKMRERMKQRMQERRGQQ